MNRDLTDLSRIVQTSGRDLVGFLTCTTSSILITISGWQLVVLTTKSPHTGTHESQCHEEKESSEGDTTYVNSGYSSNCNSWVSMDDLLECTNGPQVIECHTNRKSITRSGSSTRRRGLPHVPLEIWMMIATFMDGTTFSKSAILLRRNSIVVTTLYLFGTSTSLLSMMTFLKSI
eukprot:TRINITY_DN184_c0_g1_i5.p1 TRINITY_DN184_c0_g1~~TRINITY_DN184_c0_g1_i5.p1  ORF type:complete len:175 (+),score=14.14 TRINITY_DN184_c0_g1_i5:259-783(+)